MKVQDRRKEIRQIRKNVCFSIVLNQFDMEYWCLACLGYEMLCKAKFRMFDK